MDQKMSISFCQSPGIEMPGVRMNLESAYFSEQDGGKSENMSVYARIRPLLQSEKDSGYSEECIAAIDDTLVRAVVPKSSLKFKNNNNSGQEIIEDFTYTHAFGAETGQFVFFEQTIMNTMQSFIEGQNCLIFSYGITNSGKTYTLQGDENNPGIIILGLRLFFASIEHQLWNDIYVKPDKFADIIILNENDKMKEIQLKDYLFQIYNQEVNKSCDSSANLTKSFAMTLCDCFSDKFKAKEVEETLSPEEMEAAQSAQLMKILSKQSSEQQIGKCNIWISFIEIYNEYIYDLLQPNVLQRKKLQLAEDQNGDVYVKGAKEVYVSDVEEALKLLHLGRRNLRIASTKLNYQSSRSHCIYMIKVVRLDEDMSFSRVNRLSFCDLAGSERATKSKASGMRLKEASYINTSLLVLGRCLEQLRLNQTSKDKKLIPFRESKLTRLFSGHFLGKGKAVMIANASPCEYTFDETLNVLRFSAVAKELILNDSYIKMASNSLQNITNQWTLAKAETSRFSLDQSSDFENSFMDDLKAKDEMIEKLLDLADSLRNNLEEEKKQKAQLEITIRQDVCREYSEFSDELLGRQKEAYEERIESLKKIYNQRIQDMEKFKDDKIKTLKEQLAEYEDSDESFDKSIEKSITSNSEVVESPMPTKQEIMNHISDDEQDHDLFFDADAGVPDSNTLFKELENQIEENRLLKSELCSLEEQLHISSLKLNKSSEEIIHLQNEIKKHIDQVPSVKIGSDDPEIVKSEQHNEIEKLSAELISLKDNFNIVTVELNDMKDQLEQTSLLLKESESRNNDQEGKITEMNIKLNNSYALIEKLEDLNSKLKKDNDNLLEDCSTLEKKVANLKEIYEAESLLKQDELSLKLKDTMEEIESLNSKIYKMESECKTHVEDYNKLMQDFQNLKSEFETTTNKMEAESLLKQDEISLKLKGAMEEIESLNSKIHKMESECKTHVEDYNKLMQDFQNSKSEFALTTDKMAEASLHKQNEISAKLYEALEEIEMQESKLSKLDKEFQELELELKTVTEQMRNNDLEDKMTEMNKQLDNAHAIIEEQEALNAKLKKDNDNLQEDCSTLEKKVANLKESLEAESLHRQEELSLKLKGTMEEIESLNSKIYKMESECKTHVEDYNKLMQDFQNLKSEFETTTNKMEEASLHKQDEISLKLYEALEEIDTQNSKISKMEMECKIHLEDYNKLVKEFQELELELKTVSDQMGMKDESILEMNSKLEKTVQSLCNQETKFSDLLSEYETYKNENIILSEKCKSFEELLENSKGEIQEINLKLDMANATIEQQKSMCDELKSTYEHATKSIENLQNEKNSVEKERNEMKANAESLAEEIQNIRNERNTIEQALTKMKMDAENADKQSNELLETAEILDQKNNMISSLQSLCSSHEEEILKLKEMNKSLEENRSNLSSQLDAVKSESSDLEHKLLNATNTLKELDASLQKMQDDCSSYENSLQKLEQEKRFLEDKCNELSCNNKVESELENQLKELRHNLKNSEVTIKNFQSQISLMETDLSSQKEENLKLEKDVTNLEKEVKSLNEQLSVATKNINELNDEKQILTDNSAKKISDNDNLMKLLELCEFKASEKIKFLEIESEKQKKSISDMEKEIQESEANITELEEASEKIKLLEFEVEKRKKDIADRERQIREKEANISELEDALLDIQKEMKNLESEHTKKVGRFNSPKSAQLGSESCADDREMFALKQQHEIEITESMNLKSVAEKENSELKTENSKLKKNVKGNSSEIKTKKISTVSKKENSLDNKENSDSHSESLKSEESKRSLSLTSQEVDNDDKSKRRRALRTRQAKAVVMDESDSDGEHAKKVLSRKRKSSDEFVPQKKVTRKKQSRETKPAAKKTLRNEKGPLYNQTIEDTENMSPVQKFAKFMGSKIRSVAETVTGMPSPRMTRGRRKLFNVETTSTAAAKWKY